MIQDYLPEKLIQNIGNFLRRSCQSSIAGTWKRNKSDEDSITSAFFHSLSKDPETMQENGEMWRWSIDHTTTSSRGPKPMESSIGADVVFFIEVDLPKKVKYRKGILVQSKIIGKVDRAELERQVYQMESFAPQSSVVLGFNEGNYRCAKGRDYINSRSKRWLTYSRSFCDFLADEFMACRYGVEDLYYDFDSEVAIYYDKIGGKKYIQPQRGVTRIEVSRL